MTADLPNGHGSKTRTKVTLGTSEWIALGLFFAAQTMVLFGVGVQMWTRLAVVESEVKHVSATVIEIKQQVADEGRASKARDSQ